MFRIKVEKLKENVDESSYDNWDNIYDQLVDDKDFDLAKVIQAVNNFDVLKK